jgi:hypothetical protein
MATANRLGFQRPTSTFTLLFSPCELVSDGLAMACSQGIWEGVPACGCGFLSRLLIVTWLCDAPGVNIFDWLWLSTAVGFEVSAAKAL